MRIENRLKALESVAELERVLACLSRMVEGLGREPAPRWGTVRKSLERATNASRIDRSYLAFPVSYARQCAGGCGTRPG